MSDAPLPNVDASSLVIVASEGDDADAIATKVPDARERPAGSIAVIYDRPEKKGLFARFASRAPVVSRDARASALLARGWTDIAAAYDERTRVDCVWGRANASP